MSNLHSAAQVRGRFCKNVAFTLMDESCSKIYDV